MTTATVPPKARSFEWWMVSNLAMGAGFSAFVALLIPPYVTEVTGSAAEAGVIMAVMSLAAVLGPILGGFADRYRAHRLIMSAGHLCHGLCLCRLCPGRRQLHLLCHRRHHHGGGRGRRERSGPEYIVGAGLDKKIEASQLTVYNLIAPIGQVLGGALLGAAAAAGIPYSGRFWISAAVMLLAGVLTWLTSGKPTQRLHAALYTEVTLNESRRPRRQ